LLILGFGLLKLFTETHRYITVIWFFTSGVDNGDNLVLLTTANFRQLSSKSAFFTGVFVTAIKKLVTGICKHRTINCFLTTAANLSPVSTFLAIVPGEYQQHSWEN
jgi:hypothetical protein